jgi:hypothetical protein
MTSTCFCMFLRFLGGLITAASAVEAFPETLGHSRGRHKSCSVPLTDEGGR